MCRILNYEYKSKGGSGSYSSNGVFQNDQLMVGGSDSCQVNIPACGWWIRFMPGKKQLLVGGSESCQVRNSLWLVDQIHVR